MRSMWETMFDQGGFSESFKVPSTSCFFAKHEKVSSGHTTRQNSICLMPYSNICNICGKVCKSVGGMKRHEKVHISNPEAFHIRGNCGKVCKSSACLKSHFRARKLFAKQWQNLKTSCCHHNDDDDARSSRAKTTTTSIPWICECEDGWSDQSLH